MRAVSVAALAFMGSALVGSLVYLSAPDARADLDLADVLTSNASMRLMPGAHEATERRCGSSDPCVQAVESDTATLRRYAHQDEAEVAAARLGDSGHRSGWIVVQYAPGGLDQSGRTQLEATLTGLPADGPD